VTGSKVGLELLLQAARAMISTTPKKSKNCFISGIFKIHSNKIHFVKTRTFQFLPGYKNSKKIIRAEYLKKKCSKQIKI